MTPKERVIAALRHKQPDRAPWGEHSIDYNIYEMVLGRESFVHAKFKEQKAYWEGRRDEVAASYKRDYVDLAKALEMDLITVTMLPPKDYSPPAPRQIDDETFIDGDGAVYKLSSVTGDLMKTPMNTAYFQYDITLEQITEMVEQVKKLPDLDPNPNVPEYEALNHVIGEMGATHFVAAPVNGLEWTRFGRTEEESWMNLVLYPEICSKIAEYQYLYTKRELPRLKAAGIDGVLSVGDLGYTHGLAASPACYRGIIYPFYKLLYKDYRQLGLFAIRHCCGNIWPVIDEICETNDAYEGIQERAGMDILQLKERVGDKLCLWGGILHEHIHGGTPADIRTDAERCFKAFQRDGGFIMGSSHSLTIGATYENIMEMKKCRDELA